MKNIRLFCGRPLLYWTTKALQETEEIDEIIVATNCDEIANCVLSFDFNKLKVFNRSEKNAQDTSSTESVMLEYIDQAGLRNEDIFVLVQATSPFTTTEDFQKALNQYLESDNDSLLSVVENKHFFWNDKGQSLNYDYRDRPRRQDFESSYQENGAFYINTIGNTLLSQNRLSGKIGLYVMPGFSALELDEEQDWIIGEEVLKKVLANNIPQEKL